MHDLRDLRWRPLRIASAHGTAGPSLPARWLPSALLLSLTSGCVLGEGSLGEYTDTDMGSSTGADTGADSGSDAPACTEDCDPDFAIGFVQGQNYAAQIIHRLGTTTCDGPGCPETVSPVSADGSPIEECLQTAAAQSSPLGADEHCRIAAAQLTSRIGIGFTTAINRSSFELTRPRPEAPTDEEAYLWHPDVVEVHGPGTAMRGTYQPGEGIDPDRLTAIVNETCAARLTELGIPWSVDELESLCVGTWDDGGVLRPLKMDPAMVLSPYAGELSTDIGWSCNTPGAGPDTCCSACDRMLGPGVARYGVDGAGNRRNPNEGTAIACDPEGNALADCRDLVLDVERDPGATYTYAWDGSPQEWPLPRYDKLRETHPHDRPAGFEAGQSCINAGDCGEGQDCIGTDASGAACTLGEDCVARTCQAEWFGDCRALDGNGPGFCVDRRFNPNGAAACLAATTEFAQGQAGDRLALCDANADSLPTAAECCDPALGGAMGCDPFYQPNLVEVPRYDRDPSLPVEVACACEEGQPAACADSLEAWCEPPLGSAAPPSPVSPAGDYAVPAVTRLGGVRWKEDEQQLDVTLANIGSVPRALTETCAESHGNIGGRSPEDGWLANLAFAPELLEDHDLWLCSGSSYRVVFSESAAQHHIRSAAGGTLDGRSEHVIETPQLRIVPGSLAYMQGETLESCETVSMQLSNAYDPSEANVRKLELREGAADGPRVAGGPDCDPEAGPTEIAAGAIPCLGIDAAGSRDTLSFYVDEAIHGQVLQAGNTYFVVLPGLADIEQLSDPEAYAAAFHDACGMPLVVGDTAEALALWELSFTVDAACP